MILHNVILVLKPGSTCDLIQSLAVRLESLQHPGMQRLRVRKGIETAGKPPAVLVVGNFDSLLALRAFLNSAQHAEILAEYNDSILSTASVQLEVENGVEADQC